MEIIRYLVLIILLCFVLSCGDNLSQTASRLAESYLSKTPVAAFNADMPLEQAMKIQDHFVHNLKPELGNVIGYKAGLTNVSAQKRFNVTHPLRGVLLEKMTHKTGAVLPADFGIRPMSEADLIVRVGSDDINEAKTIKAALAALDAVIPFIELPDLVYSNDIQLNGSTIAAINVGARYGILGEPIPLDAADEWENRFADMGVEIFNDTGSKLAEGKGSDLLGHPLNVVLWIKNSLVAEGKSLKKGDLLSLGSITPLMPVKPNTSIHAKYIGLDPQKDIEIFVKFE